MGDTGSMAFGGALAGFAIVTGTEALLILIGRHLRRRGAVGDHPDRQLQVLGAPRLPDGADPPSLRDEGVVGDEDHGALLDRRCDPLRVRLRPLLPLLPSTSGSDCSAALVLGLARSGRAARAALERDGVEVVVADRTLGNDGDLVPARRGRGARQEPRRPGRGAARRRRACARDPRLERDRARHRGCCPNPLLGVTGTNGKTTTTELLGVMLGAPHRRQRRHGAERARRRQVPEDEWVVCELSSFQLEDVESFRPRIAVLLNLEPDHLDRHGSFDAYRAAKLRIFENQTAEDVAVVPRGLRAGAGRGAPGRVRSRRRASRRAADPRCAQPRERSRCDCRGARGRPSTTRRSRRRCGRFPGVEHRLELVAEHRRRALRQRLEGDEHGGCPPRAHRVRRSAAPDPRRASRRASAATGSPGRSLPPTWSPPT